MSSSHRIRFNRSLFSAELNGHTEQELVAELAAEDIDLILDMRAQASERSQRELDGLCEEASIYYLARPQLATREPTGEPAKDVAKLEAWAAGLSLRHRTCVLGDDHDRRIAVSEDIARVAGQRLIDLQVSPSPIAQPPH